MVDKLKTDPSAPTAVQEPSETANQSVARIRATIINETATISGAVPHLGKTVEGHATGMLDSVNRMADDINAGLETLSVESLYRTLGIDERDDKQPSVLKIYTLLNEYGQHLADALANYDEEITRENEMIVFGRLAYELDYIKTISENFREINTALKVALSSQHSQPYKREQVIALTKVIAIMKKDVSITDKTLDEIFDILDKHFNLAGPLADVKLEI